MGPVGWKRRGGRYLLQGGCCLPASLSGLRGARARTVVFGQSLGRKWRDSKKPSTRTDALGSKNFIFSQFPCIALNCTQQIWHRNFSHHVYITHRAQCSTVHRRQSLLLQPVRIPREGCLSVCQSVCLSVWVGEHFQPAARNGGGHENALGLRRPVIADRVFRLERRKEMKRMQMAKVGGGGAERRGRGK